MSRKGVDYTGIPTEDELRKSPGIPRKQRLLKGPVAWVECLQEIPCDVCEKACPSGAISVGHPITNLPVLEENRCVGCCSCIPVCPGLAISVIDLTYSHRHAALSFPYEFLPVPKPDDEVDAVDRKGRVVCKAKVVKVVHSEKSDRTYVLTIRVPKKHATNVRFARLTGRSEHEKKKSRDLQM